MSRAALGDDWTAERHLRKDHECQSPEPEAGALCAEEASDLRHGLWLCDRHIARADFDTYATAALAEAPEGDER